MNTLLKAPKIRLKTALLVPFLIQITAAVGLVGYFSFRNGQQSVQDLAKQLIYNVSVRIENHVLNYLNNPHTVLRLTHDNIKSGTLNLEDFETLRQYFWNVVNEGDLESYISYGNEQGEFVGVEHLETQEIQLKIRTLLTEPIRDVYRLDSTGTPEELLTAAEYDPRDRPWYQAAKVAGKQTWSEVYPFFSRQKTPKALGMSAVLPIFNSDQTLRGVLCINITLLRVQKFLKDLNISSNGQSFIIERDGELVVSSRLETPFQLEGEAENLKFQRLLAINAPDLLIRTTTQAILKKFGHLTQIQTSQQVKFQQNGSWYYAQILPIQEERGLNWLVVVVVPESDFMAQIHQNTRITLGLCLIALGIATGIGILTAHWITKPILKLNLASKNMAQGELSQQVKIQGIQELEILANSFNWMVGQLKEAFETLEEKVRLRTAQLATANQEISTLNEKLKAENIRMSAELDILKEMQQLILPKPEELAKIQELDIAGYMKPADEVGGDYYDILQTHGVVTIGIGDVTGHGLESGILMVMTQAAVRTLHEIQETDPVQFLSTLNRTIYYNVQRMNSDKNITLSVLNYSEGKIKISGQHEEVLVIRSGGRVERIDTVELGLPLGLDEDITDFISHTLIELNSGDGVVLYTDGITEAYNLKKQFYGLERLCNVVSQNWQGNAEAIKQAVIDDLYQFIGEQKQFDDITLLVLKKN